MEEAKIIIETTMSQEDYRKFLYIATFRRNKLIIPLMVFMALIAAVVVSIEGSQINVTKLVISWVFLFILAMGTILFKVEKKNKQRVKTDKTGTFDSINTLKFYDEKVVMENGQLKSTGELRYDQFFSVMESKEYFVFYLTMNQASLIRKKDVGDLDGFRQFIIPKFETSYKRIQKVMGLVILLRVPLF